MNRVTTLALSAAVFLCAGASAAMAQMTARLRADKPGGDSS
jgi:hypothetical protein